MFASIGGLTGSLDAELGVGVGLLLHLDEGEREVDGGSIHARAGGDVVMSVA